jgi:hypothetical protein
VPRSDGADFENLQLCSSHRPDALSREWDEILDVFIQSAPNAPFLSASTFCTPGVLSGRSVQTLDDLLIISKCRLRPVNE